MLQILRALSPEHEEKIDGLSGRSSRARRRVIGAVGQTTEAVFAASVAQPRADAPTRGTPARRTIPCLQSLDVQLLTEGREGGVDLRPTVRGRLAFENITVQRASTSFCRALAGLPASCSRPYHLP